jgi:hypothetical protein
VTAALDFNFAGRRVRSVQIADVFLVRLLREGMMGHAVGESLPDDARIVWAEYRGPEAGAWPPRVVVYVESAAFALLREGEAVPELVIRYRATAWPTEALSPAGAAGAN